MNPSETTAVCPVMGSKIEKQVAEERGLVREVNNTKYYMCCDACGPMFDANPDKYTSGNAPAEGRKHEHGHDHDHHA